MTPTPSLLPVEIFTGAGGATRYNVSLSRLNRSKISAAALQRLAVMFLANLTGYPDGRAVAEGDGGVW